MTASDRVVTRHEHDLAQGRPLALAVVEFDVLLRLQDVGDHGLRLCDLVEVVPLTQPSISRMVTRLERRSLVVRREALDDGRGTVVALTRSGGELLERAVPVHAACLGDSLLSRMSPALVGALERVGR